MRRRRAALACFAGLATVAAGLATGAPALLAAPDDPFTPQFSFSTSTTRAGAHPDITVEMRKQLRNRCVEPASPAPSHPCVRQYVEQNVKRMTVHFPPGAVPDPNAAPYCDLKDFGPHPLTLTAAYGCQNEDALVGVIDATVQWCDIALSNAAPSNYPDGCVPAYWSLPGSEVWFGEGLCADPQRPPLEGYTLGPFVSPSAGYTYECRSLGYAYNEAPRKDERGKPIEEGHLVVLWPRWPLSADSQEEFQDPATYDRAGGYVSMLVTHVSVRVRRSDLGVDSMAEVPDAAPLFTGGGLLPAQPSDLTLTLFGGKGAEKGHPLLTNPTSCEPDGVDGEILGYAQNSGPENPILPFAGYVPGSGDGRLVATSSGVQATDCDAVPYNPSLDLTLDDTTAAAAPGITAVVRQQDGEATTRAQTLTLPSSFKVNDGNEATFCGEADIEASVDDPDDVDHCAESSRIGTAKAASRVLPEGEKLSGNVFLKGLAGDSVEFAVVLHGFVDFRLNARASLGDDLTLKNSFDDLPQVPISEFKLHLEGGAKGLLKNPRVCGPQTIGSKFTSHSGRQIEQQIPVQVGGCKDPALDVELSNPRKGQPTDLTAAVSSTGTALESVELRLDRHLKWGKRKAGKGKKLLTGAGVASLATASGVRELALATAATRSGDLRLAPLTHTRQGQEIAAAVPGFGVTLSHVQARIARRARRNLSAKFPKSVLDVSGLPADDATSVELSLLGQGRRRPIYVRSPLGCRKPLNFVAIVATKSGTKLALKDQVRLRGRRCSRK